jgi:hypothetical protein
MSEIRSVNFQGGVRAIAIHNQGSVQVTTDLAPGPNVLTSRFGSLTPVTETVTSEEGQPTSFHFQQTDHSIPEFRR